MDHEFLEESYTSLMALKLTGLDFAGALGAVLLKSIEALGDQPGMTWHKAWGYLLGMATAVDSVWGGDDYESFCEKTGEFFS